MESARIKVLLIEDDEDDYIVFTKLLTGISQKRFGLKWASNYEAAFKTAGEEPFDVVFIDYVLGQENGLALMRELLRDGLKSPVIILTGLGDFEIDDQAMREGASDYLEKKNLKPSILERAIRYAMERARNLAKIQAQGDQFKFLSEKLLEIGEKERGLIAGELHDGIKSQLCAIKYALEEKLLRMGGSDVEEAGIPLEKIVSWTKDTISETGRICTELRSEMLDGPSGAPGSHFKRHYGGYKLEIYPSHVTQKTANFMPLSTHSLPPPNNDITLFATVEFNGRIRYF